MFLDDLILDKASYHPNGYNKINFTWDDCENAINQSVYNGNLKFINFDKLTISPNFLDQTGYCWSDTTSNINEISEFFNSGYAFVLHKMSCYNKSLSYICSKVESKFNAQADFHLYGGLKPFSCSFGIHIDQPHNLIFQTHGACAWTIYKEKFKSMQEVFEYLKNGGEFTPILEKIMDPGDVLYIPPQQAHLCTPLEKRLSFSMPFHIMNQPNNYRGWINLPR